MNKKFLAIIILLMLAVLCLCSCETTPDKNVEDTETPNPDDNVEVPDTSKVDFAKLNQMTENCSRIVIKANVDVIGENDTLESKLDIRKNTDGSFFVEYSIQQYARIDTSDEIVLPSQRIQTLTGNVTIKDGQVKSQVGDTVDYDFTNLGQINVKFNEENFTEVKLTNDVLTAKVTSVKNLLGMVIAGANDVQLHLDYALLNNFSLNFKTTANSVFVNYRFYK